MSAIVLSHRKLTCHPNWPMQGCPLKMTTFCVNICPSTYMFILSACQGNLNMNIYVITIRPNGVHRSWLDNDHDKGRLTGLRTMHQRDNRVKYDSPAGWMVNIYICVYICIVLVFVWKIQSKPTGWSMMGQLDVCRRHLCLHHYRHLCPLHYIHLCPLHYRHPCLHNYRHYCLPCPDHYRLTGSF